MARKCSKNVCIIMNFHLSIVALPGAMPKIFSDDQIFLVLFQVYFWPIEGWIHALLIRNGFWQYKIFQKAKHLDQHKVFCSWLNLFWRQGNRFKFFKKLSYYNFVKDIRTELIHAVLTLLLENTVIILLEDFFLHAQFPVTVFQ